MFCTMFGSHISVLNVIKLLH
ncbi:unnamed protein product [Staurois parvus]|uniref:Uncharacterized protein n=1 Tax=Staurois parvus TaxID=386267 RepID=A0ABN9HG30_9NEOB|nr:unnamed protein product [Staurois parvus]